MKKVYVKPNLDTQIFTAEEICSTCTSPVSGKLICNAGVGSNGERDKSDIYPISEYYWHQSADTYGSHTAPTDVITKDSPESSTTENGYENTTGYFVACGLTVNVEGVSVNKGFIDPYSADGTCDLSGFRHVYYWWDENDQTKTLHAMYARS